MPSVAGVLIQYPLYAGMVKMMTESGLAKKMAEFFIDVSTPHTFPLLVGVYSAFLGLFIPSAGGKWLVEAPYMLTAANSLHVHLGWVVQTYNATEALANLIHPFWMLPLLGILGLKARDIVGYSMLQFVVHVPVVLFLVWILNYTLTYVAARSSLTVDVVAAIRRNARRSLFNLAAGRSGIVDWLRRPLVGASLLLTALTVMLTWPQALHLGHARVAVSRSAAEHLAAVVARARAEGRRLSRLFDGNIFYPNPGTFAYSDATLLEGLLAAPWLWAHVNPVAVYNVLLLAGIISSGIGMFVLVRYLTGNLDAALVSAAIFTLVPYRVEHFMHLELQWTVWMPLSMWAVHRAFDRGIASLRPVGRPVAVASRCSRACTTACFSA